MIAVLSKSSGDVEYVILEKKKNGLSGTLSTACLKSMKHLQPKSKRDTWYLHHDSASVPTSKSVLSI